jgi:hypothetical protein
MASAWGQSGFNGTFRFLDVPVSALLSGTGGLNVSLADQDANLMTSNPALISNELDKYLSINYILFPGEIKVSNLSYVTNVANTGLWGANLVYFNYGDFQGYDPTGAPTQEFNANEYAFTISKSHQVGNYRLGANLRYVYSGIADYSASALIMDIGGVFIHPEKDLSVGLVLKNGGLVLSDYSETSETRIPLDVQIGTSFKPTHMPVRFSFSLYDLTDWQNYDDEAESVGLENTGGVDEFFQHTIFGMEFLIGKNVELLFGYAHKRRKELKLADISSSAGFSYGILIGVKSFEFGYSRLGYHTGGISNTFTLTSNLGRWIKRKEISD